MSVQVTAGDAAAAHPFSLSLKREVPVSGPIGLLGRLSPRATDRVVFDLGAFGAARRGEAMALRVAVTDPSRADIVSLGAPGCPEGLDSLLSLYELDAGEERLIAQSDDVTPSDQCSALFVTLSTQKSYVLEVQQLGARPASYQLQIASPDLCGNGVVEYGEQCDLGAMNGAPLSACGFSCAPVSSAP